MPPEMVLAMGERNGVLDSLPFRTLDEAKDAFSYNNLQEFLDIRDASLQATLLASSTP